MGAVPAQTSYRFDAREDQEGPSEVRKTLRRKVVSFSYGCFQAVEVVREQGQGSHRNSYRSARLEQIVPSHSRYAYDLIAYVGKRCLCESATLKEVQRELREGPGQLQIAPSSLYEMQQKFLFYLGRLHAAAAPVLKDYLSARPCLRWLVDGTVEPQTPVFFAICGSRRRNPFGQLENAFRRERNDQWLFCPGGPGFWPTPPCLS